MKKEEVLETGTCDTNCKCKEQSKDTYSEDIEKDIITPYGDRVLIQIPEPEQMSAGGIIVPDIGNEKAIPGTVKAVGPGTWAMHGFVSTTTKVGDIVVFPKFGAHVFNHNGEEYYIIRESDLFLNLTR